MKAHGETVGLLLAMLDQAYEKSAFHGTNLKGSLRGVTPKQAAFRPGTNRHSIRELVLHAAYWKYVTWRRLTGAGRGTFALTGSNFFPRPGPVSKAEWQHDKDLLDEQHRGLRAAVAALTSTPGHKLLRQISGTAMHDVYHTGQIQLLKRLSR